MLLVLSYILGGIPFGFIITHAVKGVDIRRHGSGNIGATNVTRVVNRKWGVIVFVLDFAKGLLAPLLAILFLSHPANFIVILCALAVVSGHNWTPFLGFKGGKGVATSLGALCALGVKFPAFFMLLVIALIVWAVLFFTVRVVSIASIASALTFLVCSFVVELPLEFRVLSAVLVALLILRHTKNIKNLFEKKELRF